MKSRYNYFDDKYEYVDTPVDKVKKLARTVKENGIARPDGDKGYSPPASKGKRLGFILLLFFAFVMIIALFVVLIVSSIDHANNKNQQFNADAGMVCSNYSREYGACAYENLYTNYGIDGFRMTGLCYAREMDFNADGRSELLISYLDNDVYYVEVWGYVNDSFTNLYHQPAAQTDNKEDGAWITIRYGDGKYYLGTHDQEDITSVELYQLKKNYFSVCDKCTYDTATEAFYFDDKVDQSFERIKLSVLREEKAESTYTTVSDTIDKFSTDSQSVAAGASTANSINNAYYNIVNDYNQKYGEAEYVKDGTVAYIDGLALVKLVDFNGDNVPELVLGFRRGFKVRDEDNQGNYVSRTEYKYCCEIYTYKNGNAVLVYENEGMSNQLNNSNDCYFMYKYDGGKNYLCHNSFSNQNYGQNISAHSTIYSFDGESFTPEKQAEYTSEYGYYHYYIDKERVYSSQFEENGYFLPLFNGNDDYDENVYTVIYLSRDSLKSSDVKPLVYQTQTAIKSLNSSYVPQNE